MLDFAEAGFIDIVYITDDFEQSECFRTRQIYILQYRDPSSPGIKTGISLALEGLHYGWVRERSRLKVDPVLQAGKACFYRVKSLSKRWEQYDNRLGVYRIWQEGQAFYWID